METILHNDKVWLTADGRLEVYDSRLATRINRYLKTYDNGLYTFRSGEEAVYKLKGSDQIQFILQQFLTKKSTIAG